MWGKIKPKLDLRRRIVNGFLHEDQIILKKEKSEIFIPPQPFDLRAGIPVDDIAFLVLEAPRHDDEDVSFPDPDLLLDLALDTTEPCNAVETLDLDVICTHHQFSTPEHLAVTFLREPNSDDLVARSAVLLSIRQGTISIARSCDYV